MGQLPPAVPTVKFSFSLLGNFTSIFIAYLIPFPIIFVIVSEQLIIRFLRCL